MSKELFYDNLTKMLDPKKSGDHAWFLSLLDEEEQSRYENAHIQAVMQMLKRTRINPHKNAVKQAKAEIALLEKDKDNAAENYKKILALLAEIKNREEKINAFRPFFEEPYFARMDLVDNVEGYNSYYIGKKGDVKLEIVDWRAPLARRYYQKSCSAFKINEYEYKTVLRRAIIAKNGEVLDFKNEYLSLKDYLLREEIQDRDEENVLDPYLREIIKSRKDETAVKDIIRTIQEKQYEIITSGERENFVLQGCAGSGKTMVMLHRLSYLMYNNEEIKPRDVLVITPSNSFNAFIDELAQILQLERVRTATVYDYFLQILKNEKIDIADRIDETAGEPTEYLAYVYSPKFAQDIQKKLDKTYGDLYGLFISEECKEFLEKILSDCEKQLRAYEAIKNSSMRVRRAVLGEIKERKEGGLYYTKAFRELMNCLLDIQDFLGGTIKSERAKEPDYFYRQLASFYKSAGFFVRNNERIVEEARLSLSELKTSLEKETTDLMRFKQKIGGVDVYTYADRIARRKELIAEVDKIYEKVEIISRSCDAFTEFYINLRGEKEFKQIGNGDGFVDIVRYFYRETVKKYKKKYGMESGKMYRSDAYALCRICQGVASRLSPAYSFVFVDEGQDISPCEYELLRAVNKKASFNVFGDIAQNVTPWRGVKDWTQTFSGFSVYTLNQNYRNTNQIVQFVSQDIGIAMQPIGFDGPQVEDISARGISRFFKDKKGLKTVICTEKNKEKYRKKTYNDLAVSGKVSKAKINLMTVYESKGLEFACVAVDIGGMTDSEKYIAYTRALNYLAVIKDS